MKPTKDKYPCTETESLTLFTFAPHCWHLLWLLPINNDDLENTWQNKGRILLQGSSELHLTHVYRIKTLKQTQVPEQELPSDPILICW